MAKDYQCWRCGGSLSGIPVPFVRLAQCRACSADLHVCRMCRFYNPVLTTRCDHEMAEPAREIDIANFCHYFRPRYDAFIPKEKSRSDAARAQLEAIFGTATPSSDPADENTETNDELATAKARFDSIFKDSK